MSRNTFKILAVTAATVAALYAATGTSSAAASGLDCSGYGCDNWDPYGLSWEKKDSDANKSYSSGGEWINIALKSGRHNGQWFGWAEISNPTGTGNDWHGWIDRSTDGGAHWDGLRGMFALKSTFHGSMQYWPDGTSLRACMAYPSHGAVCTKWVS
ncbi:hypothetical protein OG851_00825 [Streptomyces sp. NBC_00161]|uniref:hypothetical protein n=1 Tax=Streptomyces sp. NBC_00161 TaxID=2975671 RepID=UPI0032491B29